MRTMGTMRTVKVDVLGHGRRGVPSDRTDGFG